VNYTTRFPVLANGVLQVFQDSQGWMWFVSGTQVLRYNGASMEVIAPAAVVKVDFCYQVLEVGGKIRINSSPYNLLVDGDSLRKLPASAGSQRIDASLHYKGKEYLLHADGLSVWQNGAIKTFIPSHFTKAPHYNFFAFQDSLLIGHLAHDSLLVFNLNNRKLYRAPVTVHDLTSNGAALFLVSNNSIHQIQRIDIKENQASVTDTILYAAQASIVSKISTDNQGNIWLGIHQQCLVKLSQKHPPKIYTSHDGLPGRLLPNCHHHRQDRPDA
jgi:ligand-binding sensor domain-containing protein